ncbi:MAG: RNA-binding protein [Bdellovibrionota bacterium]
MKLYVGNLPFSATEEEVRGYFEAGGRQVSEVKLITDRETGRPRGFGFVTIPDDEQAKAAITELNGKALGGRPLKVNEATERKEGGGGGFRGGRGGGRGGFGGGGGSRDRW